MHDIIRFEMMFNCISNTQEVLTKQQHRDFTRSNFTPEQLQSRQRHFISSIVGIAGDETAAETSAACIYAQVALTSHIKAVVIIPLSEDSLVQSLLSSENEGIAL